MAYSKTLWKDRVVEKPRTFTVTNNPDGTITLTPSEGVIIEAGTPMLATNMNNIEAGIESLYNTQVAISITEPTQAAGAIWFKVI